MPAASDTYFNSNLVRLKGANFLVTLLLHPTFQFQSGTIKGTVLRGLWVRRDDFNSNLVRLKEKGLYELREWALKFQFQSGTIKGVRAKVSALRVLIFQFQSGTIKGNNTTNSSSQLGVISIPIWYD